MWNGRGNGSIRVYFTAKSINEHIQFTMILGMQLRTRGAHFLQESMWRSLNRVRAKLVCRMCPDNHELDVAKLREYYRNPLCDYPDLLERDPGLCIDSSHWKPRGSETIFGNKRSYYWIQHANEAIWNKNVFNVTGWPNSLYKFDSYYNSALPRQEILDAINRHPGSPCSPCPTNIDYVYGQSGVVAYKGNMTRQADSHLDCRCSMYTNPWVRWWRGHINYPAPYNDSLKCFLNEGLSPCSYGWYHMEIEDSKDEYGSMYMCRPCPMLCADGTEDTDSMCNIPQTSVRNPDTGLSECKPCGNGYEGRIFYYSNGLFSVSCSECEFGKYQPLFDDSTQLRLIGGFDEQGVSYCTPCPAGTTGGRRRYATPNCVRNSTCPCDACQLNQFNDDGNINVCEECPVAQGMYKIDTDADATFEYTHKKETI